MTATLLDIGNLVVSFTLPDGRSVRAVDGVDLRLLAGACIGIVGESGSGKSTLARTLLGLQRPDAGTVLWRGQDLWAVDPRARRRLGCAIQAVFQDPRGSLNPRLAVGDAIAEPLRVHARRLSAADRQRAVLARMAAVGLDPALTKRFPGQLSGGQCQRVAIARATVLRPDLLVCDEAVSALDVSVQAQVLHLIDALRRQDGMAVMFISHDIAVVAALADHIVVMQAGRIVDQGDRAWLLRGGRAAYTRHLLSSMVQL